MARSLADKPISRPNARSNSGRPARPRNALVLQGGGALGAYQGGVFEELAANGFDCDWVIGTSIGAINGAIVAGNPPECRLARLREFWDLVGRDALPSPWPLTLPFLPPASVPGPWSDWLQPWLSMGALLGVLTRGIPGFFEPRAAGLVDLNQRVPTGQAGFYDTSPLHATLQRLIDFDYLNEGPVRCTVCAVRIDNAELAVFDNQAMRKRHERMTPLHIMASGALPPGFPPVIIDGKAYWDGGIYSNTPVDILMDDVERQDTLCFMVDLWDPTEPEPQSIAGAMARYKNIQYASRTYEHLADHKTMQDMRHAIGILAQRLTPAQRADPAIRRLTGLGCSATVNIVRLIMKAQPTDDQNRDIDFTRASLTARWQAGRHDAQRALRHESWRRPAPGHVGMVIHELPQQEAARTP